MSEETKRKTRILLAHGQYIGRQCIRRLLDAEADFDVVGEASDGKEAVRLARQLRPDLVVMEPQICKQDSVQATRQVKAEHPAGRVLILTASDEEEYIIGLIAAGASGYLLKSAGREELVQAIRSVRAGDFVCGETLAQKLFTARLPVTVNSADHLAPREAEALGPTRGMSNHDIAAQLGGTSGITDISEGLLITITSMKGNQIRLPVERDGENTQPDYIPGTGNIMLRGTPLAVKKEEEKNSDYGYKTRVRVHIPGDTEKRATNILVVNGVRVFIDDTPLALFLRLVVELFTNKRGTIPRGKLINSGLIKAGGEFQSVNRLRESFRPGLGKVSPQDFIETCEHKSIRLSTHPSLITYDRERLVYHRNGRIRRLAKRLPRGASWDREVLYT